ncbi:sphingoid base N-palmitoyltransferase [Pancytospora philotis]|nr:sphingoid base N-palmitoyltransferase [Pancytospora philotis]
MPRQGTNQTMASDITLLTGSMAALGFVKSCLVTQLCKLLIGKRRDFRHMPMKLVKLRISVWKALYYAFITAYGILTLKDKSWVFDTDRYLHAYAEIPLVYRLYYFISLANYFNACIDIFMEPRKHDFAEMLFHHIATIALLVLSYQHNLVRYGMPILCLHDVSEGILELAKTHLALGNVSYANVLFFLFMFAFISTRLVVYPIFLVYPATKHLLVGLNWWRLVIIAMLNALVVIHFIWTWLIFRVGYKIVFEHKTADVRDLEDEACG